MQYLSQRLANEAATGRREHRPSGALAASQRERILTAAEQLIGEVGCAGASIEAIVKAAGVSSVTFYEHFPDKEACFVATFDRAVAEARDALIEAVPSGLAWPEQVRDALEALLAAIVAEPGRARMCLVEGQMGGAALAARYDAMLDSAVPWLRHGRSLSSAPPDISDALEEATIGGIAWLLRERLERGEGGRVGELLPKLVEIALAPYLGDGETPSPAVAEPA